MFRQHSRCRGRQVEIQHPFFAQEHLPQVPEWVQWQHVIVDNRMTKGGHTCRLPLLVSHSTPDSAHPVLDKETDTALQLRGFMSRVQGNLQAH